MAERVAGFVAELEPGTIPAAAVERARCGVLDTLGVALGGAGVPVARAALALVEDDPGTAAATVLTTDRRASLARAAFANALLASALDFDDGDYGSATHPGSAVVPAALAAAEARGRSGRELLVAAVIGYEVMTRAGAILNARPRARAYGSGAAAAYGAAAATARLLGLDRARVGHALGIARAHLPASPVMDSIAAGAMTKESLGWGVHTGVVAALLAEKGFTGPSNDFSEPHHATESDLSPLDDLGERYRVRDVYVKRYPACLWTHAAVEAALELRAAHDLAPDRIAAVRVFTHGPAAGLDDPRPRSVEGAQYSIPYTVAAALVDGRLGAPQMRAERLTDPRILELAARVAIAVDPRLDGMYPAKRPARTEIALADGRVCVREVLTIRGSAEAPLTLPELEDKFLELATLAVGAAPAAQLLGRLRDLEALPDVRSLGAQLRGGRQGADPGMRGRARAPVDLGIPTREER